MRQSLVFAGALSLLLPGAAAAAEFDVLWTGGNANYNTGIGTLVGKAAAASSNTWDLTFWNEADPVPDFTAFDVLVVGSTFQVDGIVSSGLASGRDGLSYNVPDGYFGLGVSARQVVDNSSAIAAARGERTFLSGQDADWHYLNNQVFRPFNGPEGFLINAVNWAASGAGLGIVSMTDRINAGAGWWTEPGSFLAGEIGTGVRLLNDNSVFIGDGQETFPINAGLTSAGLSNWGTSSHAAFDPIDGYAQINFTGPNSSGLGVTIVTEAFVDGGTTVPPIPLPAGAWLLLGGLAALAGMRRRA